MRLTRIIILLFLFPLLISLSACGKSPEKARKELDRMNIAYNSNTFVEYAQKGDITIIDLFLIAGMDPNLENTDGITALYVTSEEGHTAIVKTLLSKGANVRTNKGRFGVTPLMGAARKGHLEIVRELIRKGMRKKKKKKKKKEKEKRKRGGEKHLFFFFSLNIKPRKKEEKKNVVFFFPPPAP